ncbi:MAG TPA: hypothetical protein VEE84_00035, partial [Burkholderiaceae bacterium]|nr:hypothetical protein [Burkholderiaceae bacterium]
LLATARGTGSESGFPNRPHNTGDTLSVCRALFRAFALQDWQSWLQCLPQLEERLERDMLAAHQRGVGQFELVLCGTQQVRTLSLSSHLPWWRRLRNAAREPAQVLQHCLGEQNLLTAPVLPDDRKIPYPRI